MNQSIARVATLLVAIAAVSGCYQKIGPGGIEQGAGSCKQTIDKDGVKQGCGWMGQSVGR